MNLSKKRLPKKRNKILTRAWFIGLNYAHKGTKCAKYQLNIFINHLKIKTMKTKEILKHIEENGGFCNMNHWNRKEVAEYIYSNYNCSRYVAKNVAFNLL